MAQPKSKNVNPSWVLGPKGLNVQLAALAAKMFFCNVAYFFERLQEFIKEFKDIRYFIPDNIFLRKIKEGPFVCNDLFDGLIVTRLYGLRNPVPLYLEDKELRCSSVHIGPLDPMEEKYFWALWYAFTVDPQKIPGTNIGSGSLNKTKRHHFAFRTAGDDKEDRFVSTKYVIFEYIDGKWHYEASDTPQNFINDGKNLYNFLIKK